MSQITTTLKQFTLSKSERVKSRKVIEQLFASGKSFTLTGLRVYYLLEKVSLPGQGSQEAQSEALLQAGVGVSKRHFKKAVHRNRIKRLLREAYRLQKLPLQHSLVSKHAALRLFFIFTGKELPLFNNTQKSVTTALQRLQKEVEKL